MLKNTGRKLLSVLLTLAMVISLLPIVSLTASAAAAGDTWVVQNSGVGNGLKGVCYGGTTFVAVGALGTIITSSNGTDWTDQTGVNTDVTGSADLNAVCYGNGMFMAVGAGGTVITSSNGVTWTVGASIPYDVLAVAYGNGVFVALAKAEGVGGYIYTSADNGSYWDNSNTCNGNYLYGISYGNNGFVVVGSYDLETGLVFISTDGSSWENQSTPAAAQDFTSVCYGYGMYVACDTESRVLTSTDGTAWNNLDWQNSPAYHSFEAVCYGGTTFVTVGAGGVVYTSSDGTSWTSRASNTENYLKSVCYGNDTFVAVGDSGTIITSGGVVAPAPTVTAISPTSGSADGGTSVTITGTNFSEGAVVTFGSTSAAHVTVNSGTSITATSPAGSGTVHVTVTVAGQTSATSEADQFIYDAPPALSNLNGDAVTFTEGGSAVLLDKESNATVTDSDSTDFSGGNVTASITANRVAAEDVLSIKNIGTGAGQIGVSGTNVSYGGTLIGTYTGGTGTVDLAVSLNSSATPAATSALIKALTYSNINNNDPSTLSRTVSVTVSDGDGGTSTAAAVSVGITPVNDAPTLSATAANPTFTEDGSAAVLFSGASVNTIESGQALKLLMVTVSNLADGASEVLTVDGTNIALTNGYSITTGTNGLSCSASVTGSTATVTMSKTAGISISAMQTIINGLKYSNLSNTLTNASSRVVTLAALQDNGGTENGGADATMLSIASTVTLANANDVPVITAPASINVTEDVASPISGISFADTDAGSASVTVTLSVNSGALTATSAGGVTVGGSGAARTFTGSIADINAFIMSGNVEFVTASNATSSVTLTVVIDDGGNTGGGGAKTDTETVALTVTGVNDAPTDIGLSNSTVIGVVPAGITVGSLTTTDPDTGDTITYSIVSVKDGGTILDTSTFAISGSNLQTNALLDFSAHSSYSVTVRAIDAGGMFIDKSFTISRINHAPTASDHTFSINEDTAITNGDLTPYASDADSGTTLTYSLVSGASNGTLTINPNGTFTYSPKANYSGSDSFVWKVDDGFAESGTATATITINEVNDAPIVSTSSGTTSFTENPTAASTPVAVDSVISVSDADNATLSFAIVSITGNHPGEDKLAFVNTNTGTFGNIHADYNAQTEVLTLASSGATATKGQWQAALRAVTYTNTSHSPDTGTRTISFIVNDGSASSAAATKLVSVTATTAAPMVVTNAGKTVSESSANTVIAKTDLEATDADTAAASLTYTLTAVPSNGTLMINGSALAINGTFTQDAINNNKITYTHNGSETTSDSFTFAVSDGENAVTNQNFIITVTPVNDAPSISIGTAISVVEGGTAAFSAAATDPEGSSITWSITSGADAAKFNIVPGTGVVTFVSAPSFNSPADADAHNDYVLVITASDGALSTSKTITVTVTRGTSAGGGVPAETSKAVIVNGEPQDAGKVSTQTIGGQTVTTVTVDDSKLNELLRASGASPTVTLPVSGGSDVVVGQLNGQTVKNMEQKDAVLEIKTDTVTYTLPASQINIDAVSAQVGAQVDLKDIRVSVTIAESPADTAKIVEDTAHKNNFRLVVKPVDFEITCVSGSKTVEVSRFNGYVERTVAIPDGVDPSKITTGIVLNSDGTFRHAPTQVVVINGKYYAKINSLTNSTYSVIWNPVEFKDVAAHWAKDAVNDMGSRMIVTGVGNGNYAPDRSFTRAEFAAIAVRALGLAQGTADSVFKDVALEDWFNGYVDTAASYGLITGYTASAYGPNDTITREQAMTLLARAMALTGLKVSLTDSEVDALLSGYTDGNTVSDYAKKGVAMCLKSGVVTGTSPTTLSPTASVTRAEVAVMVRNLLQKSGLI